MPVCLRLRLKSAASHAFSSSSYSPSPTCAPTYIATQELVAALNGTSRHTAQQQHLMDDSVVSEANATDSDVPTSMEVDKNSAPRPEIQAFQSE